MTNLTIQMDDELKERAEHYYSERGLDLSEAICSLLHRSIESEEEDDFDLDGPYTEEEEALCYSPSNVAVILERVKQLDAGNRVEVTIEGLRAMIAR